VRVAAREAGPSFHEDPSKVDGSLLMALDAAKGKCSGTHKFSYDNYAQVLHPPFVAWGRSAQP
jgi:hypothetical protein